MHIPTRAFKYLQTSLAAQSKGPTLTNSVPGYLQMTTPETATATGICLPRMDKFIGIYFTQQELCLIQDFPELPVDRGDARYMLFLFF